MTRARRHGILLRNNKAAELNSAALSAIPCVLLSPSAAVLAVLGVLRVLGILGVLGIVLGVLNVLGVLAILVFHEFAPPLFVQA